MATDVSRLIDADNGFMDHSVFIDPGIYQQELEQVFARCWLFLCHESFILNPGDFFSTYMGEDPGSGDSGCQGQGGCVSQCVSPQG